MSALDPFITNPATSILPSEDAGASVDSNPAPVPDSALAQLFVLADLVSATCLPGSADNAAGVAPSPIPAPAAFFPDICELLAYANGQRFFAVSPRDVVTSLPSGENNPAVTLDCSRGDSISSPPLFLTSASFEFLEAVAARGGLA